MKVHIITTSWDDEYRAILELEKKINEYISNRNDVIDIKYQGIGVRPTYSSICPSAMVIMR